MKRGALRREKKTIAAMLAIYCEDHHGGKPYCGDCRELLDYALMRLDRCRFGEDKPVCAQCTVHCYKPAMRERVRDVMRYAGPRMTLRHPVLAAAHLAKSRKGRVHGAGPGTGSAHGTGSAARPARGPDPGAR